MKKYILLFTSCLLLNEVQSQTNTNRVTISASAPIIEFNETDLNKKWFFVGDGKRLEIRQNTTSGANTAFSISDNYTIGLGNNSSNRVMNILSNGFVGIGTTNPERTLDIGGSLKIKSNAAIFEMHEADQNRKWFMAADGGNLRFAHTSTSMSNTVFSLNNNNTVGIGITAPTEKLEVYEGRIKISSDASILHFRELDNNKNWFAIADGNDFRIAQNTTAGENTAFYIRDNSNVGIGIFPSHKLDVSGTIHAKEVLVDLNFPGPDYVFEEDYDLTTLEELDTYLKENKHLPEVPSAAQMKEDGVNMVEMDMLLLKKVEELTLYIIDLERKVKKLEDRQ